ncbi:ABC transporter permease [Undibacterium sp. Di26W]|uniref:ABC transporter permease n=1 Tax=Undibacterium sp. Di26W TaxID=3413035 RepID=UPI003BF38918
MHRQIRSIAFYTLLEALSNHLTWLLLLVALTGIGLSGFLKELALTESSQIQIALMAAFLRISAVFLLATFVVSSMVREINDKVLELLLALPLSRTAYLCGKLLGFAALAVIAALPFGLLTMFFTALPQTVFWTISLICELWIVAAFSLLCVLSFRQTIAALSIVMGFYLLSRVISAIKLIGQDSLSAHSTSQQAIAFLINSLSAVLPHLDTFTRTEWLVYQTGNWSELSTLLAQSLIFLALAGSAALFDFYRKNI